MSGKRQDPQSARWDFVKTELGESLEAEDECMESGRRRVLRVSEPRRPADGEAWRRTDARPAAVARRGAALLVTEALVVLALCAAAWLVAVLTITLW